MTAVVEASGGRAANGVEHDEAVLDDEQTVLVDEWLAELVLRQRREGHAKSVGQRTVGDAEPPPPSA